MLLLLIGFLTEEELKDVSRTNFLTRLTDLSQGEVKTGIRLLIEKGMIILPSALSFSSSSSNQLPPPSKPPETKKRPADASPNKASPAKHSLGTQLEARKNAIIDMEYPAKTHDRKVPLHVEKLAVLTVAYELGWVPNEKGNGFLAFLAVKQVSILNGYAKAFARDGNARINEWRKESSLKLSSPPLTGKRGPSSVVDRVRD